MSNEKETEDNTIFSKIIKLQSCDGETFVVESDVVSMCATVKNMLNGKSAFRNSLGGQFSIDGSYVILKKEGRVLATLMKNSEEEAVVSLPEVKASILQKVIEYCKFHNNPNLTEREKKLWDSEFVQVKQNVLCDLASASYYLDIRPLVNLTSRAIATQISGKTSEEIRETFCNINYEVYAPMFASSLATRCRLQRKINRKKQTPQEQAREMKALPPPENDNRSVDELLQFIGENNANNTTNNSANTNNNVSSLPTAPVQKKKSKKSKKKKKNQKEESSDKKEEIVIPKQDDQGKSNSNSSSSKEEEEEDEDDLDEFYEDKQEVNVGGDNTVWGEEDEEDMDPEIKAALDKEVEDFRQRLESMHSLSKSNSKIPLPVTAASFVSSLEM